MKIILLRTCPLARDLERAIIETYYILALTMLAAIGVCAIAVQYQQTERKP